jgi:hypothetical protein
MTASALEVLQGTTRRFAEARLPVTVIRRWWLTILPGPAVVARPSMSRSGEPSNDDQLTLIARISPNRRDRASISSGSSCAIAAVCGHHPPSSGAPNSIAKASRTGLDKRRPCTALFTVPTLSQPEQRTRPRRETQRAHLIGSGLASTKSVPPLGDPDKTLGYPSTILHLGLTRHTRVGIDKPSQSQMII